MLEVYLFDFNASLYGDQVAVTFADWIRPEAKFASARELTTAIHADVAAARAILVAAGAGSALDQRLAALP